MRHAKRFLLVFLVALYPCTRLPTFGDHPAHLDFAARILKGEPPPPHPLYHLAVLALACGRPDWLAPAAATVLALAVAARFVLTASVLPDRSAVPLAALLAVAAPLPNWWGALIPGQPSTNVWHSPTFMAAAPLALAAFLAGCQLLERPTYRWAGRTGGALFLSALAKPNFVLAFGPCLGPATLRTAWQSWRHRDMRLAKAIALLLLTFAPVGVVLGAQAVWIRQNYSPVVLGEPFFDWHRFSPCIPASLVLGLAFPLAVLGCYARRINADRDLTLAWCTFGVAAWTFAMIWDAENGYGNWAWGMHLATAVLFTASAAYVTRQAADWRQAVCVAVLGLHAVSGAWYLGGCLAQGP